MPGVRLNAPHSNPIGSVNEIRRRLKSPQKRPYWDITHEEVIVSQMLVTYYLKTYIKIKVSKLHSINEFWYNRSVI
jgi:hypothetical protein